MKKCIIIYNKSSGKQLKYNLEESFTKKLLSKGYEPTFIYTEYYKHALEIIKNIPDDTDLVISVGGDGTFNEIVTGNLKRNHQLLLAHIPLGTTNDIGTMWGYGKNILNNLELLLDGEVKEMDIGCINEGYFVYVAGIGKFLDVPYITPKELKKKVGHFAYIIEGIKSFFHKTSLYDLTYKIGEDTYRGNYSFVIISNANRIAGINNFYKDIKLDDGKLEILFCSITKKIDLIKSLLILAAGDVTKVPGIYIHKTNEITIHFKKTPKKKWCVDGEQLDSNKKVYNIKIISNVKILMQKKNINNLFIHK